MKTPILTAFLILLFCQISIAQPLPLYSEHQIIVGMYSGQTDMFASPSQQSELSDLYRTFGQPEINLLGPQETGSYTLTFNEEQNIPALVEAYKASGLFRYVEPDYYGYGGGKKAVKSELPNDTYFNRQYGLVNNGSFSLGTAQDDADVDMELAWDIETGDSHVIVAVLDAGAKMDHPELINRLWRNPSETENNADDDMNGYEDDVWGWDFVNNDNDPSDDHGHGTNVVGIIGADANNELGYSGVDWHAKLMICKILDSRNRGLYSWWTTAIYYAVNQGAKVINMSVGGSTYSQSMEDAINYAHSKGVTVVACMMNNNNQEIYYPAGFENTIAVGATNPDDTRAAPFFWSNTSGSSYGEHIDVVAPGNYIYGLSHRSDTNYDSYWGGTSQATPLVAGIVSLLIAQDSSRGPEDIRAILRNTAEDQVGDLLEDTEGFDIYYGYGRVNAHQALMQLPLSNAELPPTTPEPSIFPNPANDQLTINSTKQVFQVEIYNNLGQLVISAHPVTVGKSRYNLDINNLKDGQYLLIPKDQNGHSLGSSILIIAKTKVN